MWRELIERVDARAVFHSPATTEQLRDVEAALGIGLPAELSNLLEETNGVEVVYGLALVWSTEAIVQRNREMRDAWQRGEWPSTMPIDQFLFFGDCGNGDLYCLPITREGVESRVLLWDHEDDSRTPIAASLAAWLAAKD